MLPRMPCPHSKACAGTRAGAVADLRDRRLLLDPPWPPVLTDEDVQRAAGYYGTGTRLRRVAAKLLAGLPIKVTHAKLSSAELLPQLIAFGQTSTK